MQWFHHGDFIDGQGKHPCLVCDYKYTSMGDGFVVRSFPREFIVLFVPSREITREWFFSSFSTCHKFKFLVCVRNIVESISHIFWLLYFLSFFYVGGRMFGCISPQL